MSLPFFPLSCCDCRKDDVRATRTISERRGMGEPEAWSGEPIRGKRTCGLGITFREDTNGVLSIHSLLEGGAGLQCGQLLPGDILVQLEGTNVDTLQPELLASISQGLEGSSLVAVFHRPPTMYHVSATLVRSVPTEAFT
mmetsp:Transcript_7695/g.18629  ORF Transcript_7695/g.18629 Transcript_7695/m.18629 type:complete len:140 (-) Transcript_7695:163-582(-)|eukprot:CAMPEP_0180121938 /NCGR_PEP_ID=MMETSP0986-20121125/3309_1 /TAXON_ID=697907 /ORGANISM="non described non described, Strain CCMP2293" /LENGTH=139 /DNA_ID=CAMNT_0022061093 /DNA_START=30 /DNA_END=449 /DNA_ORIENTATION=-